MRRHPKSRTVKLALLSSFAILLTMTVYGQHTDECRTDADTSGPIPETNAMINKIQLDVDHRDKTRMEAFLRILNGNLRPLPFNWKSWDKSKLITDAVKLANNDNSLTVTLIFLSAHSDADIVAKANAFPDSGTARWGANGAVMYVVESPDEDKVKHVLSVLAGEE